MSKNNQEQYFEEEGLESINRFEAMIKGNVSSYFDVYEFENIIDYYLDQHNIATAHKAIDRGLRQHPNSSSLKLRLAQACIQNGKPSKGLHFLREIEPFEKENYEFYLLKGTSLNLLGKKEDAHQAFDRAIQLAYDGKDEVIYSIALSYLNTRRYNLAIRYLKLSLEVNPSNLMVVHELALVYEKLDMVDESIEYYNMYLELDPFAEHIWFSLGMVYSNKEDFENALKAYDYAIALNPSFLSTYFSKANTQVNSGNYKDAIDTYYEIIFLEPDNVQAFTYIGECYEKLDMLKRSIYFYKKAIEIDSTFGDAWFGLGMACYTMEDYEKGLNFFIQANKLDPENPEYWFMLGEVYRKLKLLDKSAESYNRAVELDPNDYEAWLSHADILFMEDKVHQAISTLNRAYQFNHDVATINYNLAAYYLYNNEPEMAYKFFEKGLSINYPEHSELLEKHPIALKNATIKQLIKKYKNLSR